MTDGEVRVTKPAVYIRWSTEDQGEGTTLDVQLDACRAFIVGQGWTFRDELVFIDDGISGATMERPALTRLRTLIKAGQVDCVVVYKLDRLSRTVLDMLKLVLEEWDGLCSVKSAREPIDTLTATGKMFFYQLMSFAEWERNVIRDRTFSGKLRRAMEGKSPGIRFPYGYRRTESGGVEQDPDTAPVVRRMFRLYLSGLGIKTVAVKLSEEGYRPPKGQRWSQPSVADMLKNPAYIGVFVYGRTRQKNGKKIPREPLVVRENFYPAIITRDEFEAAQRLREERPSVFKQKGTGRSMSSSSLLSGLLKCTCGYAFTGRTLGSKGNLYHYYFCAATQKGGMSWCTSGPIRQGDLDALVVGHLKSLYQGTEARQRVFGRLSADLAAQHDRLRVAKLAAEKELDRVTDSERRLKGWLLDGQITLDEFRQLQTELALKLREARKRNLEASEAEDSASKAMDAHVQTTQLLDHVDDWDNLSHVQRKQLLRQFINQIVVFKDRQTHELTCDISWKWAPPDGSEETYARVFVVPRVLDRVREENARRPRVNGRFVSVKSQG